MRIRLKLKEDDGDVKRINSSNAVDNVILEEDLMNPEKESVAIFFRGRNSSGIINFRKEEIEGLMSSMKPYLGMIKRPFESTKKKSKSSKKKPKKTTKKKRSSKKR